jgi:hypothetical protein
MNLPFAFERSTATVGLANAQCVKLTHAVTVDLEVAGVVRRATLRVLPTQASEISLLFGRRLIAAFDIVIDGECKRAAIHNGVVLVDHHLAPPRDKIAELREEEMDAKPDLDWQRAEMPLPPSLGQSDRVTRPISDSDASKIDQVLDQLVLEGIYAMPLCPSTSMRLRRLEPHEPRDLPEQTFQFELQLKKKRSLDVGALPRGYSGKLYNQLGEVERGQFDQLVEGYVTSGWWEPWSPGDEPPVGVADVFMVGGGQRKPRLVCDFKTFNEDHAASSVTPRLSHPLMMVRTLGAQQWTTGDISKAFYKVRLEDALMLRVGDRRFKSNRMCFGTSFGPEGLRLSFGRLFDIWRTSLARGDGVASVFVDDFVMGAFGSSTDEDLAILLTLLARCGFDVSASKFRNEPPLKLLGCDLHITAGTVTADCGDRATRSLALLKAARESPTKRLIFRLCGVASYDPLAVHAPARVCCNIIRSVVGSDKGDWNQAYVPTDRDFFGGLLDWLEEILRGEGPCQHKSIPSKSHLTLRLSTDASIFGYGYVIESLGADGSWSPIWEDAGVWKGSQFSYGTNRLEGLSLFKGLSNLASYVEFLRESTYGDEKLKIHGYVQTDSSTALAWTRALPSDSASRKSLEYRMLTRLSEGLQAEAAALRNLCDSVEFSHLAGKLNTRADDLSRLAYRAMGTTTIGSHLRSRHAKGTDPLPPPVADRISMVQLTSLILVEEIAKNCANLSMLLEAASNLQCIWNSWRERTDTVTPSPDPFARENLVRLARLCQAHLPASRSSKYVLTSEGIHVHEMSLFTGEVRRLLVIPEETPHVARLIAAWFHRKGDHRGGRFLKAYMLLNSPFFIERATAAIAGMTARCLTCCKKAAFLRPAMATPPGAGVSRHIDLPPFSRVAIDVVHFAGRRQALTALCLDTHCFFASLIEKETATCSAAALGRLSSRYCVRFRLIHSDNAQVFSHSFQSAIRAAGHFEVEFTTAPTYAPRQSPVERMHRELWSIFRSRKFSATLTKGGVEIDNDMLDEVSAIINSRPLYTAATPRDGEMIITPSFLAFGVAHGTTGAALFAIRRYFYENYFLLLRRRHLPPRARRHAIFIGQMVLGLDGSHKSKHEYPFVVGRVAEINGGQVKITSGGQTRIFESSAVAPLPSEFQLDSLGGHVEN